MYIYICLDIFVEFSHNFSLSQLSVFLSWIWLVKYLSFNQKCDLDVNLQSVKWMNTFYDYRWLLLSLLRSCLSQLYHWFQKTPDVQFLFPAQSLQQIFRTHRSSRAIPLGTVGRIRESSDSPPLNSCWCIDVIGIAPHDTDFHFETQLNWIFCNPWRLKIFSVKILIPNEKGVPD